MSFISQSMKNKFPSWSKVRRTDSSNMGIILDCVGEEIEKLRENGYGLKLQQKNLLSYPFFEEKKLYKFDLKKDENYLLSMKDKQINSISLTKKDSGGTVKLEFNWNKFCFEYPSTFEFLKEEDVFEIEIKENVNEQITLIKEKQLYIILENLEEFEDSNSVVPGIIIRGENTLGREIEEYIEIRDIKTYKTKSYFKVIKPLIKTNSFQNRVGVKGGPAVELFGFDLKDTSSKIKISSCGFGITKDQVKSQLTVSDVDPFQESDYSENSNLKNELFVNFKKENNKSFVEIIHKFLKEEKLSLVSSSKLKKEFFEEKLCIFELGEDAGESYEADDWAIDTKRNNLITIKNDKKLRYYPIKKPEISRAPLLEESKDVDLVLECSESYVTLGQEVMVSVSLERPKNGISKFFIVKTLIADGSFQELFLNEEKAWEEEPYLFSGNSFENKFENIKPSLFFTDTIDNYGQTTYHVCSLINNLPFGNKEELFNKVNNKILNDNKGYTTNKLSVICSLIRPEKTIDLQAVLDDSDVYEISIEGIENALFVRDSNLVTKSYIESKETGYFSQNLEALYFKNKFEEDLLLEIFYTDGTVLQTELIYGDN